MADDKCDQCNEKVWVMRDKPPGWTYCPKCRCESYKRPEGEDED